MVCVETYFRLARLVVMLLSLVVTLFFWKDLSTIIKPLHGCLFS